MGISPRLRHAKGTVALLLTLSTSIANGDGLSELPDGAGPFKLRMTVAEFTRVTGVAPESCPICIDQELYAALEPAQAAQHLPTATTAGGVDFFFYRGKLYQISTAADIDDLFVAKKEYAKRFGGPGEAHELKNGTGFLQWDDAGVVVTVNYHKDDERVFAINYIDWELREHRDAEEARLAKLEAAGQQRAAE